MAWVSTNEAHSSLISFFNEPLLDSKVFSNWAKVGKEIAVTKNGRRNGYEDSDVERWKERIENSLVQLTDEDYKKCFTFSVEAYYGSMTRADFNRGKQRDVGEFITNQVQGKLGEIAVQRKLQNLGLEIDLDFDVNGQIPSQDVTRISTRRNVWNNPACKVSIKSTKIKNILLAIPEVEINTLDRRSDIFILSQVGLFSDHLLRLIKSYEPDFLSNHLNLIPDFGSIPARVGGWIDLATLIQNGPMETNEINRLFGINMASRNFIKVTGELSTDWQLLKNTIIG